jgi:fatty-acyl-CoA synthase
VFVDDILRLNARARPRDVGLVVGDEDLTWPQLEARVGEVASALNASGVGHGDRVAVLGKNSLEYFLLYFATARIGAVIVPLNFWHRAPEHRFTVSDAEPRLLFRDPSYAEVSAAAVETRGASMEVLTLPGPSGDDRSDWMRFLERRTGVPAPAARTSEDAHMILYTSGTTGSPKGAVLSHGRTVADAFSIALALGIRGSDVFLNYFPPFHVGNWDHMKMFLLQGAKVVLLPEFDAEQVLAKLAEHRATVLLGVPTMLHALLEAPTLSSTDLSALRLIYYGAYDPSGIMTRTAAVFGAREGKVQMAHCYGLTEAGCFVAVCPPEEVFRHWGSIGRPLPGVEVALLDDELREVTPAQPGEICVRGARMSGYWRNPEATAEALAGGWLHTGDIAVSDSEGFLNIVDRKKDMIRSGGQNIYSKEVEDCLATHPVVAEVAVIAVPDPVYEEQICAIIVPAEPVADPEASAAELIAHVRAQLAGYNAPRRVEFVAEMPKTAVGKIQKNVLRDRYGSVFGAGSGPSQAHGSAPWRSG